jgi:hypothetical protein
LILYQVNNSVAFNGKPAVSDEFLNQMVEALGITIDRHPKRKPHEMESSSIEKVGCNPILIML